jgi:alkanesulfonate monooxygenase SsuD/methylene tetrahydromethanopterin reductase-like flavin-dependent oxidoreductase (luciferase family)
MTTDCSKPIFYWPNPIRGSSPTFEKAGRHGIGALGFNFSPIHEMRPMIEAYKKGIAECTEPVGRYINDNVMLTNGVLCFSDEKRAREIATRQNRGYLYSLVCLYHDTFPKPDWAPVWPEPPIRLNADMVGGAIASGSLLCGTPEQICEQLKIYETTGVDQVAFGFPNDLSHDEALECIELFGREVIPEFDKDPVHSTDHYRATAR